MKRVNGSSCILLYGTLLSVIFIVSTTQISNTNATRWHPDWNQHIKLFYNKLLNRQLQSQQQRKSRRSGSSEGFEDRSKKLADLSSPGNARNRLSDDIYLESPSNMVLEDPIIEGEKRASFRLKKIPEDAIEKLEPFEKRASFRLKRILDSYKDLFGQSSSGYQKRPAFRLRKRGGTSSFRLKRVPSEELNKEYDVRARH